MSSGLALSLAVRPSYGSITLTQVWNSTRMASVQANDIAAAVPWHAAYPAPREQPGSLAREQVLEMLKSGARTPGRDFLLIDLRRNDHEVWSCLPSLPSALLPQASSWFCLPPFAKKLVLIQVPDRAGRFADLSIYQHRACIRPSRHCTPCSRQLTFAPSSGIAVSWHRGRPGGLADLLIPRHSVFPRTWQPGRRLA